MKNIFFCVFMVMSGLVYAQVPIYSLGFDFPLGDTTRFVPEDGYTLETGYGYKEKAFYESCPVLYDNDGNSLNWNVLHPGLDVNSSECPRCDQGNPVYSVSAGIVIYARIAWGNQYNVLIKHYAPPNKAFYLPGGGRATVVYSLFAHLESIEISEGQIVHQGQCIGAIGDYPKGAQANSHLHFEIRIKELSATYFCGNNSDAAVNGNYVEPYAFISLNRGVSVISGLYFSYGFTELAPEMPLSARFTLRNFSPHWLNIRNVVVAIEHWDEVQKRWDMEHPFDMESNSEYIALAPYFVGKYFPSLTKYRYFRDHVFPNFPIGKYRAKAKIQVAFGDNLYWYDLPQRTSDTKSVHEFFITHTPKSQTREVPIKDLSVSLLSDGEYRATWSAPGSVSIIGSEIVPVSEQSYDIRYSETPLTKENFSTGVHVYAGTPASPGETEQLSFTASTEKLYLAVAPNSDTAKLSNVDYVSPECTVPSAITGFLFTEHSDTLLRFSWDQCTDIDFIEIWRRDGTGEFTRIDTLAPLTHSYADTGLTPDTWYTYTVIPYSSCGPSEVASVYSRKTDPTPTPPPPTQTPDLVITDLVIPTFGNIEGGNYDLYVTIKNCGDAPVDNADLRIYQSDTADIFTDEHHETSRYNTDFAVGEEKTLNLLVDVPYRCPDNSTYHIGAWIDYRNDILELKETNNQMVRDITYKEFDPLTYATCEAVGQTAVCSWSPDFFEEFSIWDQNTQSYLYEGTSSVWTGELSPGIHDVYINGYDRETNSYCPFFGPIQLTIESPQPIVKETLLSNGTGFSNAVTEPLENVASRKVLLHSTGSDGQTVITVYVDEQNNVVVHYTENSVLTSIPLPLSADIVRYTAFLNELSPRVIFCTQTSGFVHIYSILLTTSPGNISTAWEASMYTFNFDRVIFFTHGDFSGDGVPDIGAWYLYPESTKRQKFFVWAGNTDGTFGAPKSFMETDARAINPDNIKKSLAADVNGDGKKDLVFLYSYPGENSDQSILVWLSQGTALKNFTKWLTMKKYSFNFGRVETALTGDYNGDGLDDIGVSYSYDTTKKIFCALSLGTQLSPFAPWMDLHKNTYTITSPDVNGDTRSDMQVWPYYH